MGRQFNIKSVMNNTFYISLPNTIISTYDLMENFSKTQKSTIKKSLKSEKIIKKTIMAPRPRPRLRKESDSDVSPPICLSNIKKSIDLKVLVKKLEAKSLNSIAKTEIMKKIVDKSKNHRVGAQPFESKPSQKEEIIYDDSKMEDDDENEKSAD